MNPHDSLFETEAIVHLNGIFRTALHVTGDRAVAEDLVQETFLQAWKSFNRYEPGTNCRAWLYKILFYVVRHHRRRWSRMRLRFDSEFEESIVADAPYEPPVPQDLTDEDVLAALGRIPEAHRELILLVDVEGFSYQEAADTLGVPIGTVMSRHSRGRARLRQELADYAASCGVASASDGARPVA